MLSKVKLALRIATDVYDPELLDLIAAAIMDLHHAGPVFAYAAVTDGETGAVTDYSVPDPLASMAVVTYCRAHFGSPADYDKLKAAYDEQKGQMRESSGYGMMGG